MASPLYHHMLAAVDFGPTTHNLLSKANALAHFHQAKLSLVHVIERSPVADHIYVDEENYQATVMEAALEKFASIEPTVGLSEADQLVRFGSPSEEIIKLSAELECDLSIGGGQSHHRLAALLGSTTTSVLNHATCDVMVQYTAK